MPGEVLERAGQVLGELEARPLAAANGRPKSEAPRRRRATAAEFGAPKEPVAS